MSVTLDNALVSLDTSVVLDGEDVFVPAKNILNNMDIELTYSGDTFTAVREDGKSMEVTLGESEMKANGQAFEIKEPYLYEDTVLMVPFKALENAFGTTISNIDEENKKIDIKTNYTHPEYETSSILIFEKHFLAVCKQGKHNHCFLYLYHLHKYIHI